MQDFQNKNVSFLIIEDEGHNSRLLSDLVHELRPVWQLKAILESVEESVNWLKLNPAPELIFMDIQLSDGICFSIFEQMKLPSTCKIIFTTAYDEYAVRAFKVNSVDYLLKPIEKNELEESLQKYEELNFLPSLFPHDKNIYTSVINSILKERKEFRTRFLVSGINSWQKIESKDIAYIYSNNRLTFAVDFSSREYTLDYSLEQLESELDPELFFRANRKIIIHFEAILKIENDLGGKLKVVILPEPDFEISVSRLKANDFKNWMGK